MILFFISIIKFLYVNNSVRKTYQSRCNAMYQYRLFIIMCQTILARQFVNLCCCRQHVINKKHFTLNLIHFNFKTHNIILTCFFSLLSSLQQVTKHTLKIPNILSKLCTLIFFCKINFPV